MSVEDEVVVRRIGVGDAAVVAELCGQLGYARTAEEVAAWVRRRGDGSEQRVGLVAVRGETEVVGWIEVSVVDDLQRAPFALIGGLVVKDGVRGGGVGRRLCAEAEAWGWAQGAEVMRVTSRSTREGAHRFYRRDGYAVVKTSVVFEKTLGEMRGRGVEED